MSVRILIGDVLERIAELADESVHCVVTSPPYWGLRDYGTATWEGGDSGCDHIKSDLAKGTHGDGTTKNSCRPGCTPPPPIQYTDVCPKCGARRVDSQLGLEATPEEHVERMVEVFREVKRVLRGDGTLWLNYGDSYAANTRSGHAHKYNREDTKQGTPGHIPNVWGGGTETPVKHPTKPKDLVGMPWRVAFGLQADGWYLRSDIIWAKPNPMPESVTDRPTKSHEHVFLMAKNQRYYYDADAVREAGEWDPNGCRGYRAGNIDNSAKPVTIFGEEKAGRNLRDVWTIPTHAYSAAHFATFPPKLVEPCIKAGCPEDGTVLDPFGGAGTVGLVADQLGRDAILIELNEEYAGMARRRIYDDCPMFTRVELHEREG